MRRTISGSENIEKEKGREEIFRPRRFIYIYTRSHAPVARVVYMGFRLEASARWRTWAARDHEGLRLLGRYPLSSLCLSRSWTDDYPYLSGGGEGEDGGRSRNK